MSFCRAQIIAANEAFPEAAVADPIADLELWEEWNRGTRAFPYPGSYCRLGLSSQEGKTTSPSSVGVLGEIMAGLFAQAGISPWVIVRVVRRWPDFIFYTPEDGRYSFVEAKAFTTKLEGRGLLGRVHGNLLGDVALDAVRQINADPFVRVWGAFTHIATISPMSLRVTFVEFDCSDARRQGTVHRALPHAVVEGLATQAIWRGAARMPEHLTYLDAKSRRGSQQRTQAEKRLIELAKKELRELLPGSGPSDAIASSRDHLESEIVVQVRSTTYAPDGDGRRFSAARVHASTGREVPIRNVATKVVTTRDMLPEERHVLDSRPARYAQGWYSANQPASDRFGRSGWRCGGALFYVVDGEAATGPQLSLLPVTGEGTVPDNHATGYQIGRRERNDLD